MDKFAQPSSKDEYHTVYCNAQQENGLNEFVLRISNTEKEMFEWIEFVVMKNLPVGFVDCPYTRKITRLKPVSTKTLCQNVLALFKIFLQSHLATSIPKDIL